MDNASEIQTVLDQGKAVVILEIQMHRLNFIYLNFVVSFLDKTKNFKFKYIKSFFFFLFSFFFLIYKYGAFDCLRSKQHFLFQILNLRH